jgi:glycerol-3-phosphate acyltransferase PlsY
MGPFEFVLVGAAYLAGSIPFGMLLTRWLRGVDVRGQGSGNIGATNVARVAGKKLGAVVLLLDALKGALPVLFARLWQPEAPWLHVLVALAAVLGHVFPVWLRFRGGKGVATALGVFVMLAPLAALAGALTYAVLLWLTRVSSIGSLVGTVVTVVGTYFASPHRAYGVLAVGLFSLMLYTHRGNIGRLLRRAESRL